MELATASAAVNVFSAMKKPIAWFLSGVGAKTIADSLRAKKVEPVQNVFNFHFDGVPDNLGDVVKGLQGSGETDNGPLNSGETNSGSLRYTGPMASNGSNSGLLRYVHPMAGDCSNAPIASDITTTPMSHALVPYVRPQQNTYARAA